MDFRQKTEEESSPSRETDGVLDELTLERLGRERPPSFSGAWPEVAFCFSIIMSQILAVGPSNLLGMTRVIANIRTSPGVFYLGIQCPSSSVDREAGLSAGVRDLAVHFALASGDVDSADLRPSHGHVWRLCGLHCRSRMADHLVDSLRCLPVLAGSRHLPGPPRPRSCSVSPVGRHDSG